MDPGQAEPGKGQEMEPARGVLEQLSVLESRARLGRERRQNRERNRERIRELQRERERLWERICRARQGRAAAAAEPREVLEWKIGKIRDLLRIFQLTGVSAALGPPGLCLCLHAAFRGRSLGSFALRWHCRPRGHRGHRGLRLRSVPAPVPLEPLPWHCQPCSVPPEPQPQPRPRPVPAPVPVPLEPLARPCQPRPVPAAVPVPLQALARRLLPRRPREFVALLFQSLNALEGRRFQLETLLEEFPECIPAPPSGNSLCNLLSLRYRIPKNPQNSPNSSQNSGNLGEFWEFRARLRYGDALRSLPTDVSVEGSTPGIGAPPEHRELLRSLPLAEAFGALRALGAE